MSETETAVDIMANWIDDVHPESKHGRRLSTVAAHIRSREAEIIKLTKQLETLRGAMAADDARLRDAGMRSDCYVGCDTPDAMADKITRLSAKVKDLTEALRPFAEYAECKCDCCNHDEDVIAGPVTNDWNFTREIKMGDLRKARSVYEAAISRPESKIEGE